MMMFTSLTMLVALAFSAAEEMHTTLDDNHDLDAVVKDPATLEAFTSCFIERSSCTDLTASFKKNMAEAIDEACRRCNDGQKHMFRVYLEGLEKYSPQMYKEYSQFYDPTGEKMGPMRQEISKY